MRLPLFLLLVFILISNPSFALDIEQAYRLIPYKQTPFILKQSKIPETEADNVARLLSLTELAMVERVEAMKYGPVKSQYRSQIDIILSQLEHLNPPQAIQPPYQYILAAIQQHRGFFDLHGINDDRVKAERKQLANASHRNLIAAYNLLMQRYPQETKHNKQAFFDYLCALDFI